MDYLIKNGFNLVTKNYRVGRLGEIDIIAWQGKCLCFMEVKTRSTRSFGLPCEAVNWKKQNSIRKIASIYLSNMKLTNTEVRFDIVEIIGSFSGNEFVTENINLIQNAF